MNYHWSPVVLESTPTIKAAAIELTVHRQVTHVVWADGTIPGPGDLMPTTAVVMLKPGVNTVAWVGGRGNFPVGVRIAQAADTLNKPVPPYFVKIRRSKSFRH